MSCRDTAGQAALRAWLDEPAGAPSLEFEGMIKVFFADSGSLDQMRATLSSIADDAETRLAELEATVDENIAGDVAFPKRLPINTIGLSFMIDHERVTATWARWAIEQIAYWRTPTDPGTWDYRVAI